MKLWRITQEANGGCDTHDSAVVAAETADQARHIHPRGWSWGEWAISGDEPCMRWGRRYPAGWVAIERNGSTWAAPEQVTAVEVGTATDGTEAGAVICASFNAG